MLLQESVLSICRKKIMFQLILPEAKKLNNIVTEAYNLKPYIIAEQVENFRS